MADSITFFVSAVRLRHVIELKSLLIWVKSNYLDNVSSLVRGHGTAVKYIDQFLQMARNKMDLIL